MSDETDRNARRPSNRGIANGRLDDRSASGSRTRTAANAAENSPRHPHKAWTTGLNPITQKPTKPPGSDVVNGDQAQKTGSGRVHALLANCMGLNATITTKSNERFRGIFFGTSTEKSQLVYQFRMVQAADDARGPYLGSGEDHAMSLPAAHVVDLAIEGLIGHGKDQRSGHAAGFQTDGAISGNRLGQERELKAWVAPADSALDDSLEASSSKGNWDQFSANEKLFGVKSDYDENIYTTKIDKSHPRYREREAAAAAIARKMGDQAEANEGADWDEEERYSGVRRESSNSLRSNQPDRYQPPARRLPTGKPTVPGAPVDPAIITSHVAEKADAPETAPSNPATEPGAKIVQKAHSSFKQFSENQKKSIADDRRQRVLQDKASKLNDLRSFSKNFSLKTPVPSDLVPILAKDKKKQDEIREKAQRNVDQQRAAAKAKQAAEPVSAECLSKDPSNRQAGVSLTTTTPSEPRKLNVKATEFVPNPNANAFTPAKTPVEKEGSGNDDGRPPLAHHASSQSSAPTHGAPLTPGEGLSSSQSMMMLPGRMPTGYPPYAMAPGQYPYPPMIGGYPGMPPGVPMGPQYRPYGYMPHYVGQGPPMVAPMMTPQGSQGSYPGGPVYGPPHMGPGQAGFPSPGRSAPPMMAAQGSFQGQTPQMFMHQYPGPYHSPQSANAKSDRS